MDGQKSLGGSRTLEPLHLAFPSSGRLMRVLRSVVAPTPAFMATRDSKITRGRAVGSQVIGHNVVWGKAHFLEQFPHQFQCSSLVSLPLHQHIEDLAFDIDGTP
jgi:hypothetical protein